VIGKARPKAKLFVISAPSGSGKTTLCNRLLGDRLGLVRSISATTRLPRDGEADGADYHFVSERRFRSMIARRQFLEHEENFGAFYGTPRKDITAWLAKGQSVLLNIDVKGGMKVRKAYPRSSVLIFILPPSIKVLKQRLHLRRSDSAQTISARLEFAKHEMAYKDKYDHRVINDKLDAAHKRLKHIIAAELKK
jgi:guanylate kinase